MSSLFKYIKDRNFYWNDPFYIYREIRSYKMRTVDEGKFTLKKLFLLPFLPIGIHSFFVVIIIIIHHTHRRHKHTPYVYLQYSVFNSMSLLNVLDNWNTIPFDINASFVQQDKTVVELYKCVFVHVKNVQTRSNGRRIGMFYISREVIVLWCLYNER